MTSTGARPAGTAGGPVPAAESTVPVAAGPRLDWDGLPAAVRAWVADVLGAPVVEARTQTGGFSPGVAARLVGADGHRAFVKAVGTPLNPDSPGLHRAEAATLGALPPLPFVPRLLGRYDDGEWVALLQEDVQGRSPALPWTSGELRTVLDLLPALAAVDTTAMPALGDGVASMRGLLASWDELAADPPHDLDPWLRRHLAALHAYARRPFETGTALVHLDLRSDNLLVRPDGGVTVVDWAHAVAGPPWLDLALLLVEVEVHGGHDVDAILAAHPLGRTADPEQVTLAVLGFSGLLETSMRRPAPPGLPTIRPFQRAYAASTRGWLRRRFAGGAGTLVS